MTGTVYDLSRYASTHPRIPYGKKVHVSLCDEVVGNIGRERLKRKGRHCWRWVGYAPDGEPLPDTVSTDKMATARAVATAFLMKRIGQ